MASTTPPSGPKVQPRDLPPQDSSADVMIRRRGMGAINIRGIHYQVRCAALEILRKLLPPKGAEDPSPQTVSIVHLEGVEDLDHCQVSIGPVGGFSREAVQVKSSKNSWDVSKLWDEVLKDFVVAYLLDPTTTFRLVHSMDFASGHATELVEASRSGQSLDAEELTYWTDRFDAYRASTEGLTALGDLERAWDWTDFSMEDFLRRVTFEQISEDDLDDQIRQEFIDKLVLKSGQERPYVNALLWSTLDWSRESRAVTIQDIRELVQEVAEDILRGLDRLVVEGGRLVKVSFKAPLKVGDEDRYFEGESARPEHIGAELPVRRLDWERQILEIFDENDVTVIRASSGQGKSTLAWQVVKELSERGFQPYELSKCETSERTDDLVAFLKSRVKVGELPLVVLDGLRSNLKAWKELAECTRDLPIKYVVTTREEDWRRFGGDPLGLRLRDISLEMTRKEAQAIYESFQAKDKIDSDAPKSWQAAWEQVQETGLLIEYVSFITSGQMLAERIDAQVKALNKEPDSAACLEILRLVSLADVCDLPLSTSKLLAHVQSTVGFQGDRGEALERLRREYYLNFEDSAWVSGLHPVRSQHLLKRLHRTLSLSDTLIRFLPLVDAPFLLYFCAQAPLMIDQASRPAFLRALAENIAERSYVEMVLAIEGMFMADAVLHCDQNRTIYDQVASYLGSNEIAFFIVDTFLWSDVEDSIGLNLSDSEPNTEVGLQVAQDLRDEVEPFDPAHSLIRQLSEPLQALLSKRVPNLDDLVSISVLEFWFHQLGLPSPIVSRFTPEAIGGLLATHELADLDELFSFLYIAFPEKYQAVMATHRSEILDRLCLQTDTLSVWEEGDTLYLDYFLDDEGAMVFTQNRNRIDWMFRFFPGYAHYCAQFLYPPSDYGDRLYSAHRGSFGESLSAEALLGDKFFSIRLLVLWVKTIVQQYTLPSVYEWQQQWIDLREASLTLADVAVDFLQNILRGASAEEAENLIQSFMSMRLGVLTALKAAKRLESVPHPDIRHPFFDQNASIDEWSYTWQSFLSQFEKLTQRTPDRDLCIGELRDVVRFHLPRLHPAYREVLEKTSVHFDPTDLERREIEAYERLYRMVVFFDAHFVPNGSPVPDPAAAVQPYFEQRDARNLQHIRRLLDDLEVSLGLQFTLLDRILDHPLSRKASIEVHVPSFADRAPALLPDLCSLAEVEGVDVFCVYLINDRGIAAPFYFPFSKTYLQEARRLYDEGDGGRISLPMKEVSAADEAVFPRLASSSQVRLPAPDIGTFKQLYVYFWKLNEVKRRLADQPQDQRYVQRLRALVTQFETAIPALFTSAVESRGMQDFSPRLKVLESEFFAGNMISLERLLSIFDDSVWEE